MTIFAVGAAVWLFRSAGSVGAPTFSYLQNCTTASSSVMDVGPDLTTEIVGTTSRRLWMRFSVAPDELNIVTLNANRGEDAVSRSGGVFLHSTTTPFYEITPDKPYDGSVDAITDTSSTTVSIQSCTY